MTPPPNNEDAQNRVGAPAFCEVKMNYQYFVEGYSGSLSRWVQWLAVDDNATLFLMWKIIEENIERRERGVWEAARELPTSIELRDALDSVKVRREQDEVRITGPFLITNEQREELIQAHQESPPWLSDLMDRYGLFLEPYTYSSTNPHPETVSWTYRTVKRNSSGRTYVYFQEKPSGSPPPGWWGSLTISEQYTLLYPNEASGSPEVSRLAEGVRIRGWLEDRAGALVGYLRSSEFYEEFIGDFNSLAPHLVEFLPGLCSTVAGQKFMNGLLDEEIQQDEPITPIPHPLSLNYLLEQLEAARTAGTGLDDAAIEGAAAAFIEWCPILLSRAGKRGDVFVNRVSRFLSIVAGLQGEEWNKYEELRQLGSSFEFDAGDFIGLTSDTLSLFEELVELVPAKADIIDLCEETFASLAIVLSVSKAFVSFQRFLHQPDAPRAFALGSALIKLSKSIYEESLPVTAQRTPTQMLKLRYLTRATQVLNVYDTFKDLMDAVRALERGEAMVAAGHGLQAVGSAAGLVAAIALKKKAVAGAAAGGAAVAGPPGAVIVGGSAAALVIIGSLMVIMGRPKPQTLEHWFKNNLFGANWSKVKNDENPASHTFRWRHPAAVSGGSAGSPNLPRQVSAHLSLISGFEMLEARYSSGVFYVPEWDEDAGEVPAPSHRVSISLRVPLYYWDSLAVLRGWDAGGTRIVWSRVLGLNWRYFQENPNTSWPEDGPGEMASWKQQLDYWFEYGELAAYGPPPDPEQVNPEVLARPFYIWTGHIRVIAHEGDPKIPQTAVYVEVDLVNPRLYKDAARIDQGISLAPDSFDPADDSNLVLRARRRINWSG